jgi:hypothetical protein
LWPFLFEVLRQYGFSNRFLDWLAILLSTASTKVLLNGAPGLAIWHRRGLRQGDPLSPQLFVLAVDTLGRLFRRAAELSILQRLHPRRAIPTISLYADDVVLFCHPTPDDIVAVREILQLFGRASGLCVNYQKSTATLLRCDAEDAAPAIAQLGCPIVDLPIIYLGIPLTLRRPTASQLQPLVDKTAGKLPTWKSRLMNKAGRLAFVKSVLSAIPLHMLLVLDPPKHILKLLERIQRGFLWVARAQANGGNCHVNWRRVCRPISLGGLGIQDLARTGLALRLRWLWYSRVDSGRAWSGLDLQFTTEEREFFFASTHMMIGNGHLTLFWEDRWIDGRAVKEIAPQLYASIPKRRRKVRTVAAGLQANCWARDIQGTIGIQEIGQYLQLWRKLEGITLTTEPDTLIWKWTSNGTYSAQSAYLASFHGAITCAAWKLTWRSWAPPRVRFFQWLANLDRCWTADRLARRGLQHPPRCPLCDQAAETIHHLMMECPFTRQIWHETIAWLRIPCLPPDGEDTLTDWWRSARRRTPKQMHKGLASTALLVPWMVWKHRNECIFDGIQPSFAALMTKIKNEATMWARAGALGLRAILPQTWDVH